MNRKTGKAGSGRGWTTLATAGNWDHWVERIVEHPLINGPWTIAIAVFLAAPMVVAIITTPLNLMWQAILGGGMFLLALWINRIQGRLAMHMMILLSMLASTRYIYWRLTSTLGLDLISRNGVDAFFALGLIAAELYAFLVLFLGFFQVLWPLRRKPLPLPQAVDQWPVVDVFIPTYNEPLKVVRPTILAALDMDWPRDKMRVYVLDDGRREDFRAFCEEVGATHITRSDSKHAKAGNINRALEKTSGEFVAIFDCDHIPTRSFLQVGMGWFLKDPKMAMMQTPHHFFSPDPFERNLGTFRKVPNEGELFYGLLQDGNDLWNATFFCGSCAIMRRSALADVGGVAVETVTEDAHTALKMHRRGWCTGYLNIAQAAGLATESLSAHVGQRIRWARGMAQIFRIDNPLLGRGLSFGQRICYANAMLHFFYGLPRIIFLTAPLSYLFFTAHVIEAAALMIAAYALPHIALSSLTNSRIQGRYRHSFWAEAYETVLAAYILGPTLLAVINPKLGTFNVTAKGGMVGKTYFDGDIAQPYLILMTLNVVGLGIGFMRLFVWNRNEIDTVVLNMLWTIYNLIMIGVALSVAWESKQVRRTIRVETAVKARVRLANGDQLPATTVDISEGGTSLAMHASLSVEQGADIEVALAPDVAEVWMPASVIRSADTKLMLQFKELNIDQERQLVYAIFGRADAWVDWSADRKPDSPGDAFKELLALGFSGSVRVLSLYWKNARTAMDKKLQRLTAPLRPNRNIASFLLAAALVAVSGLAVNDRADAAPLPQPGAPQTAEAVQAGTIDRTGAQLSADRATRAESRVLTFESLGISKPIRLRGTQGEFDIPVPIRDDEVVTRARIRIKFQHSPSLIFPLSHLNIFVNNELATTIPLSAETAGGTERTIDIDPKLFVEFNHISVQLIAHYTMDCEDPVHTTLWGIVSNKSALELDTVPLALKNDLNLLPEPFFDERDVRRLTLPFVFAGTPSLDELEAAGVIASWFGSKASYRGARFPVYIDTLPPGHAVVFVAGGRAPAGLTLPGATGGARVSIMANPRSPESKLLVVSGTDGKSLRTAARALSLGSEAMSGETTVVRESTDPDPRKPYDAPRWIPTDRPVTFGELVQPYALEVSGLYPDSIKVPFHLPPDLFFWESKGAKLNLKYRYTPTVGSKSTLNVNINNEFVEALPLSYTGEDKAAEGRINLPFVSQYSAVNSGAIYIPDYKLGGDNTLQFQYYFERKKEGACKDIVLDNLRGAIDEDSTIDLSAFPHYTYLPELALFANGGFPFTRLADLAGTAIVLPDKMSAEETEAYLSVMGRFGNATGYPASRFKLGRAADIDSFAGSDILVIGAAGNQPLLTKWADYMPMTIVDGTTKLRVIGPIERLRARWQGRDVEAAQKHAGRVILEAGKSLGAIMSFESPLSSGHTAVVLTAGDAARLTDVANIFTEPGKAQFVRGDLVLLNGDELNHYFMGSQYSVGHLPPWIGLRWWFSRQPLSLIFVSLIVALLLAVILYRVLRNRAIARKDGHI
jgi:cellulose synthase (UDP-forming)